nr:hypothetical protein CFP56_46808 [Quercus suber]
MTESNALRAAVGYKQEVYQESADAVPPEYTRVPIDTQPRNRGTTTPLVSQRASFDCVTMKLPPGCQSKRYTMKSILHDSLSALIATPVLKVGEQKFKGILACDSLLRTLKVSKAKEDVATCPLVNFRDESDHSDQHVPRALHMGAKKTLQPFRPSYLMLVDKILKRYASHGARRTPPAFVAVH